MTNDTIGCSVFTGLTIPPNQALEILTPAALELVELLAEMAYQQILRNRDVSEDGLNENA